MSVKMFNGFLCKILVLVFIKKFSFKNKPTLRNIHWWEKKRNN